MPSEQIIAVILAGGLGTRIHNLLPDLPKPMAPVHGKPFLTWIISYLIQQGIKEFIISTGYLNSKIEDFFKTKQFQNISIKCVKEPTPLGTAGGFLNVIKTTKEHPTAWLVTNGDSLILANLKPIIHDFLQQPKDAAILGLKAEDTSRYGTISYDSFNNLLQFKEKQPGTGTINTGIYLLKDSLIEEFPNTQPLSFEKDLFPSLILRKKIHVYETQSPFLDIGTPETLCKVDEFIKQNITCFNNDHFTCSFKN